MSLNISSYTLLNAVICGRLLFNTKITIEIKTDFQISLEHLTSGRGKLLKYIEERGFDCII